MPAGKWLVVYFLRDILVDQASPLVQYLVNLQGRVPQKLSDILT
jgi:hypothetical protein